MSLKIKSLTNLALKAVFISALTLNVGKSVSNVEFLKNISLFNPSVTNNYYCGAKESMKSDQETNQTENESTPSGS